MFKISSIVVLLFVSVQASPANLPDFPFVVATGKAQQEIKPDIATISIKVLAFGEDSDKALEQASIASKNILNSLNEHGIRASDIEASDIRKNTKRERKSDYTLLNILGYEITRTLKVTLNNLDNYSELMEQLVSIDNVSSISSEFDTSKREIVESNLLSEAGIDAKEKAGQMARSLGTSVKSVYAISQSSNFGSFFATFGSISYDAMLSQSSGRHSLTMFVPETIEINQAINVVFRIK